MTNVMDSSPLETPAGTLVGSSNRDEWLERKKEWLGASEVSVLFDASNWGSPFSLWAEKSGKVHKDDSEPTRHMQRGCRFEPAIAEEVRESLGWDVTLWPQTLSLIHGDPEYKIGCTLDCVVHDDEGLAVGDFKLISDWMKKEWVDEPPLKYQIQIQTQMQITGIHRGYLFVVFGLNGEVEAVPVEYHEGFQAELKKRVYRFWDMVDSGEAPDVDGKDCTFSTLKRMYPTDDGTTIALTGLMEDYAKTFTMYDEEIKRLEKLKKNFKAELIAALGPNTYGNCPGGLGFSYKKQSKKTIDAKALRKEHPEIAEEFTKETSFRVLRQVNNKV